MYAFVGRCRSKSVVFAAFHRPHPIHRHQPLHNQPLSVLFRCQSSETIVTITNGVSLSLRCSGHWSHRHSGSLLRRGRSSQTAHIHPFRIDAGNPLPLLFSEENGMLCVSNPGGPCGSLDPPRSPLDRNLAPDHRADCSKLQWTTNRGSARWTPQSRVVLLPVVDESVVERPSVVILTFGRRSHGHTVVRDRRLVA
jgi:hypothetical protein